MWKNFFAGWTYGIKEGKDIKSKIILTCRIIKHSFQGLWWFHIKPKLLTIFN